MYISSLRSRGGLRRQAGVCACCRVLHLLLLLLRIGSDLRSCVSVLLERRSVSFFAELRVGSELPSELRLHMHTSSGFACPLSPTPPPLVFLSHHCDETVDCQATGVARRLNGCQTFYIRFSEKTGARDWRLLDAASILNVAPIKLSAGGIPGPAHSLPNKTRGNAAR